MLRSDCYLNRSLAIIGSLKGKKAIQKTRNSEMEITFFMVLKFEFSVKVWRLLG